MDVQALMRIIRTAWNERTTDDWHPEDPGRHHCGVTALVAQDFLNGEIVRNKIAGKTVYFNRLPDGSCLFHRDEYEGRARKYPRDQPQTRDRMMTHPDMPKRYALLSARVSVAMFTQGDPCDLGDREQAIRLWDQIAYASAIGERDRFELMRAIQAWAQAPFEVETWRDRARSTPAE